MYKKPTSFMEAGFSICSWHDGLFIVVMHMFQFVNFFFSFSLWLW